MDETMLRDKIRGLDPYHQTDLSYQLSRGKLYYHRFLQWHLQIYLSLFLGFVLL
jgi:hypothetical protein